MTYRLLHISRHMMRLFIIVGLFFALMLVQTSKTTYADGVPGGNISDPVVRAVDIAKPAVVRIITQVEGHLTVRFSSTSSVTFPQTGNPYPLQLSGSGTFISAHGEILTADHVVNPPHDSELSQYLDQLAAQDVASYINQHAQPGASQVTKGQVALQLQTGQIASDPQYGATASEAFFSTAYTGPLTATSFRSLPQQNYARVDSIEKQSPVDQKDVAVIHVPLNDTASVQIGDSSSVQQQDELTIIGFPGNGDVSNNPTDVLTSSINKIIVSSIKTTDNGAPVLQVGGNVEQGDSGGPALNSSGKIVGVVSFGISHSNSPGSTNFLQASSSARELVQSLNLDTTPGSFQKQWSQAFADYASNAPGHWHKSQSEFQQIQNNYPQFKAVTPYLDYAQTQAKNETSSPTRSSAPSTSTPSTPVPIPALAWTIGALTLIAFLALLIVGVGLVRGRNKVVPATAGVPGVAQPLNAPPVPTMQHQQAGHFNAYNSTPAVSAHESSLTAFGAPPQSGTIQPYPTSSARPPYTPAPQSQSVPAVSPDASGILRPWPCGHMNRSNARFCSICGEPAPEPPTTVRRVEQ